MQLSIQQDVLRIKLGFWEKIWAVRGSLKVPLGSIEQVSTGAPKSSWTDIRAPGSFVPRILKAGSYYTTRGREFWYVARGKSFLTIELKSGRYNRIILALKDNVAWAEKVNHAIGRGA